MKKIMKVLLILLCFVNLAHQHLIAEPEFNHFLTLYPPDPQGNGWYGSPASVSEDLITIAEIKADVGNESTAGKVHLYDSSGDLIITVVSPIPFRNEQFGRSVEVYKDYAIVGDMSNLDASHVKIKEYLVIGRAYLFDSEGNLLLTLMSPNPSMGGSFGTRSVCLTEEKIFISEIGADIDTWAQAGKVHIYNYQGEHLREITSPDPITQGQFGGRIKAGENFILISEAGNSELSFAVIGKGSVYMYDFDGNLLHTFNSPSIEDYSCFGTSLAVFGDKILIGENFATVDGNSRAGRVHLYDREGVLLQSFQSPSPEEYAQFGWSISIDGDTIVVGEPFSNVGEVYDAGKVHIFNVNGSHVSTLVSPNPTPRSIYGFYVKIRGDKLYIGEPWTRVDGKNQAGEFHIYKIGATESKKVEEETTTETEEPETEPSGVIPGYSFLTIGLAIVLFSVLQRAKNFKFYRVTLSIVITI